MTMTVNMTRLFCLHSNVRGMRAHAYTPRPIVGYVREWAQRVYGDDVRVTTNGKVVNVTRGASCLARYAIRRNYELTING